MTEEGLTELPKLAETKSWVFYPRECHAMIRLNELAFKARFIQKRGKGELA